MPCQYGVPSSHMFCVQWPSASCVTCRYRSTRLASWRAPIARKPVAGFDEIPRPDEVIAAQVVVALREAPRNGQAGDHAALDAFRFMCAQHRRTQVIQRAVRRLRVTCRPRAIVCQAFQALTYSALRRVEVLHETDERVLTGFHRRGTEAEGEHERTVRRAEIDFAGDGDVAVLGALVGPDQPLVGAQLLPPIREPDEPGRSGEPRRRARPTPTRSSLARRSSIGVPLYSPTQAVLPLPRLARWGARSTNRRKSASVPWSGTKRTRWSTTSRQGSVSTSFSIR